MPHGNTSGPDTTIQDAGNKSDSGQGGSRILRSRLPKNHSDYWLGRLRHRSYRNVYGATVEVPEWQVQFAHAGKQRWVNLRTADRTLASKKARDTWLSLISKGWDAVKPSRVKIVDPSVGEFLAAVRAEADLMPGTFAIYGTKFRRLVAGVCGIQAGAEKHDRFGDGHRKWLARVEGVKLSRITAEGIQRWKTQYVAAAGGNPLKDRRARRTIASVLRSSKALFADGIVKRLKVGLPTPLPLAGVDIPRVATSNYVSKVEPAILFQQAQRDLEQPTDETIAAAVIAALPKRHRKNASIRPVADIAAGIAGKHERRHRSEQFKILCLALFAGLRRDEIDTLQWTQIDFENLTVRVETNEHTRAKSEHSETSVDIDETLAARLKEWMQDSKSEFVIASRIKPRPTVSSYHHYRCHRLFRKLATWLRAHGLEERNALHALRKEFGTQINRSHGLFAASSALRHSSIQLTRAVYVAKKDRATFALPEASTPTVTPIAPAASA